LLSQEVELFVYTLFFKRYTFQKNVQHEFGLEQL